MLFINVSITYYFSLVRPLFVQKKQTGKLHLTAKNFWGRVEDRLHWSFGIAEQLHGGVHFCTGKHYLRGFLGGGWCTFSDFQRGFPIFHRNFDARFFGDGFGTGCTGFLQRTALAWVRTGNTFSLRRTAIGDFWGAGWGQVQGCIFAFC